MVLGNLVSQRIDIECFAEGLAEENVALWQGQVTQDVKILTGEVGAGHESDRAFVANQASDATRRDGERSRRKETGEAIVAACLSQHGHVEVRYDVRVNRPGVVGHLQWQSAESHTPPRDADGIDVISKRGRLDAGSN